ncbi:PREDICTED: ketimine reductase mu-crystallin-like [Priapulus caudatus]|uniref:Ketimine reductase mu-crystallin n=1 Tax=Priapulus caudatus TaxID=37621 RepID=A0ABM1ESS3_PRICU|nr:PREDICTED: ketimine reductase mu-crystallin-like [Priapulus caudatus]
MAGIRNPLTMSAETVSKYLDMRELIDVVERSLGDLSDKESSGIEQPVRTFVPVKKYQSLLGVMPGYSAKDDALATKLVSVCPQNAGTDIPTHLATILLFEPSNGCLKAIMDGEVITTMRTAAASAAATKYLARDDSKILAIIGAGHQARSHIQALSLLYDFTEVRIWSRTKATATALAHEFGARVCESAEEAVKDADIICTVTFSATPVLQGEWVKAGAHVNAVGACIASSRELSESLTRDAIVYVDSREGALKESGDIIINKAEIYAEVGEVILGRKEAFKHKTTVFISLGVAIEDVVSAKLVYDKYVASQGMQ